MSLIRVIQMIRLFLIACVVAIAVGVGGYQAIAGSGSAADSGDDQAWTTS